MAAVATEDQIGNSLLSDTDSFEFLHSPIQRGPR